MDTVTQTNPFASPASVNSRRELDTYTDSSDRVNRVNDINGLETTSSDDASAAASLNFDTFLRILTIQLQNQDPLNPVEDTEFTSQIAEFSGLEQQIATNAHLERLVAQNNFSEQSLAISYIGKEALIPGDEINFDGENGIELNYDVEGLSTSSLIEVRNSDGDLVKTIEGTIDDGLNTVLWDGTDSNDEKVEAGVYSFSASAVRVDGEALRVTELTFSEVESVETAENGGMLMRTVDGRKTTVNDASLIRAKADDDIAA